ncbi:MAG: penicillin-binding protein 2 [Hyphomicrobiales bacterium]|nr:penicillin-binding protein 2 [Hyphomicrobiales bacterium]
MTFHGETHPASIQGKGRRAVLALMLCGAFGLVSARLITLASETPAISRLAVAENAPRHAVSRSDIVDRNGQMLATDIRVYWLQANPSIVGNPDETAEQLAAVLPGLNLNDTRAKLKSGKRFAWIKRGLTPREAAAVHNLGVPGLTLIEAPQRVYPAGETLSHVLGHTDVDNIGLAGLEKYIDGQGLKSGHAEGARPTVRSTIDLRVQHVVRSELATALTQYRAKAAGAILMNANNGDVIAMSSLPDFDPNRRDNALEANRQNRLIADTYELGSVFKAFTVAMLLDADLARPSDQFDIATPLQINRFTLRDVHAKTQYATVEDILAHSSNTGAARLGLKAGPVRQKAFLTRLGLLSPLETQIGRSGHPLYPDVWREINTATISYGHGLATSPLAFAAAAASLVNGGSKVTPRFMAGEAVAPRERVLKAATSQSMRRMMHLTVESGTGRRARIPGFGIGGKTGTAIKPKPSGGYSDAVITSFVSAFPIEKPEYLLFVMLDEPHTVDGALGNEAAYNAVPVTGDILKRVLPILGLTADLTPAPRVENAAAFLR